MTAPTQLLTAKANIPFDDLDPRIAVTLHRDGYYIFAIEGMTSGPYASWREAYRMAEAQLAGQKNYEALVKLRRTHSRLLLPLWIMIFTSVIEAILLLWLLLIK